MTAEALATTLNRPLGKLDLSTVLSKWLGESEKQIGQVFDLAELNAVLVLVKQIIASAAFKQQWLWWLTLVLPICLLVLTVTVVCFRNNNVVLTRRSLEIYSCSSPILIARPVNACGRHDWK